MTDGELTAIEQRLCIWNAGLNALGASDRIPEDQQRATDQYKLLTEVRRLRSELIKAYEPADRSGEVQ